MIPTDHGQLDILALAFGTLAGPLDWEPRTEEERLADRLAREDAEEAADRARRARLQEMRRRLWEVLDKLPADEQHIIQGLLAGRTHRAIAADFGLSHSVVTEAIPVIIERIRFWLAMPTLPDTLRAHLVDCAGVAPRVADRIVAYLIDGKSLRDIATEADRHHVVIYRGIERALRRVRGRSAECKVCAAVVEGLKRRRDYRPSTAKRDLVGEGDELGFGEVEREVLRARLAAQGLVDAEGGAR